MRTRKFLLASTAAIATLVAGLCSLPASSATTGVGLFPSTARPAVNSVSNDTQSAEPGVRFTSSKTGAITGIRFYKGSRNTGTHTATLWHANGSKIASAKFKSESAVGWQTANFNKPVKIKAGTEYVASYSAPKGGYALSAGYFAKSYSFGPLTVPAGGGVLARGGGFPTASTNSDNYWVDVIFASTRSIARGKGDILERPVMPTPHQPTSTSTSLAPTTTTVPPTTSTSMATTTTTPPPICDTHATTANLLTQVAATPPGNTVCLAPGNYGTWNGTNKAITLRPELGAAASMHLNFGVNAANFTIDGLTITSGSMIGNASGPHDITVRNSTFTGPLVIDGVENADILLDNNTHNDIDNNANCTATPARIHLSYGSNTPSGVTIQNSLMDGGNTDGIQAGTGFTALNNEFRNIHEKDALDCAHTDTIQLIGAKGSVLRGNYIHHSADGIVAYDGVDSAIIENNVIDLVNGRYGIELYTDNGSIIRNNTLKYGTGCAYVPCGQIVLDRKMSDPPGSGTIIENNIASGIDLNGGSTAAVNRNNMMRSGATGSNFSGTPAYVGGGSPTTYNGFKLANGSPGRGASTSGTDVGI
jgi:hypothetical protein